MGLACWRLPFLFFWFKQVQSLLLHRLSITILRDACQRPSKFQSSYTYSGKHTLPRAINKHCTSTLNPVCHQIYELWNFDYLWHPPLRITFGSLLGRFFLWEPLRQGQRSKVQSLTAKAKGWQRSACTKTRSNTLSKWWILWSTYDAFEFFSRTCFRSIISHGFFLAAEVLWRQDRIRETSWTRRIAVWHRNFQRRLLCWPGRLSWVGCWRWAASWGASRASAYWRPAHWWKAGEGAVSKRWWARRLCRFGRKVQEGYLESPIGVERSSWRVGSCSSQKWIVPWLLH